jgi:hypothetical protein
VRVVPEALDAIDPELRNVVAKYPFESSHRFPDPEYWPTIRV